MWRPFAGTISTSFLSLPWNGGFEGSVRPSHCPCLDLMVSHGHDQTCAAVLMFCSVLIVLCSVSKLLFFSLCSNSSYQIVFDLSVSRYKIIQDHVPTTLQEMATLGSYAGILQS